jgi:hypothetical protein
VRTLDLPHAVEQLVAGAQVTFGTRTPAAPWTPRERLALHHGGPADMLAAVLTLPVEGGG